MESLEDRTVPTGGVAGDAFADAIALTGTSASAFASTTGATGEAGEPDHAGTAGQLNSVWFKWTAPATGKVTVDTAGSNFDTVLAVYTGTALGNLQQVAANDDTPATVQSEVTFAAVAGTTYYFAVDGYRLAAGEVTLSLAPAVDAPANDDFASALAVGNGTYASTNRAATGEAGEPDHGGTASDIYGQLNSVWFEWTAPADGTVDFDTFGSDFDTVMGVYTGDTLSGLTEVAANDDARDDLTSAVSLQARAGTTYYIAVDGYSYEVGNIVFNVRGPEVPDLPPLPPAPPLPPPPPANAAPVVADQTFGVAENSAAGTAVGAVAATDDGQGLTFAIVGGTGLGRFAIDPATGVVTVAAGAGLNYEGTNSYTLVVRVTDGGSLSADATVTVGLTDVNDAPVLSGSPPALDPVSWSANPGTRVGDLIAGRVSDADAGALQGIAVVGADTAHGSWQFSADGGATWQALGSVSGASARLLTADMRVRFVPTLGYSGMVVGGLTFRAWDQTSGVAGGLADTTANGGATAFSSATLAAGVTVLTPQQQIGLLLALTGTTGGASGTGTQLAQAQSRLAQGNVTAAANNLNAFSNQVQALVRSGRLAAADGAALVAATQAIIAGLRA